MLTSAAGASRGVAILAALAVWSGGAAAVEPLPAASPAAPLKIRKAELSLGEAKPAPGTVILEIADRLPEDPPDAVRLAAVLQSPPTGESAADLFALNAVLVYPSDRLEFVAGSLRKGNLLGRDGRDTLITGGVQAGKEARLTIGASRLGSIPGVSAPKDPTVVFTLALKVLKGGEVALSWPEATFIDSKVHPVGGARFAPATLLVETEGATPAPAAH
jgi:hypothetical protein